MNELKPCRICGSSNVEIVITAGIKTIVCHGCYRTSLYGHNTTTTEMIADWNRRNEATE